MATQQVKFTFQCDKGLIEHFHSIPDALLTIPSEPNEQWQQLMRETVLAISSQYEAECLRASSSKCIICTKPAMKPVMLSALSGVMDDHIYWAKVLAVCSNEGCEGRIREAWNMSLGYVGRMGFAGAFQKFVIDGPAITTAPCAVCDRVVNTRKCGRCLLVSYCGKEHQKEHWAQHKKDCTPLICDPEDIKNEKKSGK